MSQPRDGSGSHSPPPRGGLARRHREGEIRVRAEDMLGVAAGEGADKQSSQPASGMGLRFRAQATVGVRLLRHTSVHSGGHPR